MPRPDQTMFALTQGLTEDDIDDEGDAAGQESALRDGHAGVLQVTRDVGPSCNTDTQ